MKLLLIVPLIALALFNLPQEKKEENRETYITPTVEREVAIYIDEKDDEIYTPQIEHVSIETESPLIVELPNEVNITRDNIYKVEAKVKKSNSENACNFFWRENGELIGLGETLEKEFSKGEHTINLTVQNGDYISQKKIIVKAWDYKKIQRKLFDKNIDDFELIGEAVYDHKERLLRRYNGFATYSNQYNEQDQRIEYRVEYESYPEDSYIRYYTYNEDGQRLSIERVTLDEEPVSFQEFIYNEEGIQIATKRGVDCEHLEEIRYDLPEIIYDEGNSTLYSSTYSPEENQDKVIYNEKHQIIYEKHDYGYVKETNSYEYDKDSKLSKSIRESKYSDKTTITTSLYNKKGETISSIFLEQKGEEVICNYTTQVTYNQEGQRATVNQEVIDGDCSQQYVETSYKRFTYNKEGSIDKVIEAENNTTKESFTMFKMVTFFTNSLEEE